MRARISALLSFLAVVSCGRQASPQRSPEPARAVQVEHAVKLNGFAIDVKGKPPAVPVELDAGEGLVLPDIPGVTVDAGAVTEPADAAASRPPAKAGRDTAERAKRAKWLVQFDGPIHAADRARLEALGAVLGDYLPEFAFVASMDDDLRAKAEKLPFIRGVTRYKPAYKIARHLKDETGSVRGDLGTTVKVRVRVDAADGLSALLSAVHGGEGKVLSVARDVAQLEVAPAELALLARLEEVLWIEEAISAHLLNDTSRWVIQSYVPGSTPMLDGGLDGTGQIVGVGDTGLDADMCFFRDPSGAPFGPTHRKVVGYASLADQWDGDMGHGTHVSGTVAGDQLPITGATTANGMAPKARLFMTDLFVGESNSFTPPDDLAKLFAAPYEAGVRIHTNSWGSSLNWYESFAWSTDRFMWEHKDFLALFANGNAGPGEGTVGSPATAKNVISVGATENGASAENVAVFSSNGPTMDGRQKPTVTAPGVGISSADSDGLRDTNNCGTISYSGTSMATPTTAGAAALVRQYFVDGYWPSGFASPADAFVPSAALLKATLINSAQAQTGANTDGPMPATGQGWGRINLSNTLRFAGDSKFLDVAEVQPGIGTGATWSKQFFSLGGLPLKVTLVWTDYPGAQMADTELVNDLDLQVVAPDGSTTYLGNVFSGGASITGGAADRLNVEEQVYLPVSARGTYTVRVSGFNIPSGPQPFALVVTGAGGITSQGFIGLDRQRYGAATTIDVKVGDRDLNVRPDAVEEAFVTLRSAADPGGETVRLVETGPNTSIFTGTIQTGHAPGVTGDGILAVSDGGAITATYADANDGSGAPATVTATALGDLVAPVVSGVTVSALGQADARVAWTTNEPASATLLYGKTAALGATVSNRWLSSTQELSLGGLEEGTTYVYVVQATDEAGNVVVDDGGGALRTFTTRVLPPEVSAYSSRGGTTDAADTVVFGTALDPSGVASLSVNGLPVAVRATDGYFEATVPLVIGENRIAVTATDGRGETGTTTVVVDRVPLPDLTVTSVTAPDVAGLATPFTVSATVCNVGPGDVTADYYEVYFFLSEDDLLGPGDVWIGGFGRNHRIYSPLASGSCGGVTFSIPANDPALLGHAWHVGAYARVAQLEASGDNNDRVAPNVTALEPPDLTVAAVTAPARVGTGAPFDLTTTVANAGRGKALAFLVHLYLSTDDAITPADRLIATQWIPSLDGYASATTTTSVTLPSDLAAGTYRLGAIVDVDGKVQESNEGNNALAGAQVVVDGPDLQMTSVSGPATVPTGGSITVHDTVTALPTGGGAGPFTVGIYLSPDAVITAADAKLGERTVASLAPGAASSGDTTITIPTTWQGGSYYLGAIADMTNEVVEADEGNNAAIGSAITVVGPDLVAAALAAPPSLVVGQSFAIDETVAASALGGNAPPVEVAFYLSTDPTITGADTLLGWRSAPALSPGASSTATTPLALPTQLAPGTYYVGVVVDDFSFCWEDASETRYCVGGDVAKEPDEANNVRVSGPITIGGTDLTVTELSAPPTGASGMPLVLHDTVAAAGGGTGSFRVGYYLSTDANITTSDTFLGYRTIGSVPPNGTSTADTTVTVPATIVPATYYIGAIVDYQGSVAEASETNNARAGNAVTIAGSDLTVSAVSGPSSVGTATPFTVTATAANQGAGASPAAVVSIYLSSDAVITASDLRLTYVWIPSLAPGQATTVTLSTTIPDRFAAGTYRLGAIVDAEGVVKESDETNNARAGDAFTLVGPDLEVTAAAGPASALTGASVTLSYTLSALPTGGGASGASVGFFLSRDLVITPQDALLGTKSVGALAPGTSSSGTVTLTVPTGIAGGTYYLGAFADPSNSTAEANETNNGLAANLIQITGPDLAATEVSGPPSAARGTSISVSSTVAASAAGGAAPGFYVGLFLSTDPTITSSDRLLGYRWVSGLSPGARSSESTVVALPATLAPGTYYLGVIADDFAVCEWNWSTDTEECTADLAKEPDATNNALAGGTIVVTGP